MYPNDFYTTKSCVSRALIFKSDGYKQPVRISSSCNIYSAEKRCGVGNELYEVITLDLDKICSQDFRWTSAWWVHCGLPQLRVLLNGNGMQLKPNGWSREEQKIFRKNVTNNRWEMYELKRQLDWTGFLNTAVTTANTRLYLAPFFSKGLFIGLYIANILCIQMFWKTAWRNPLEL